MRTQGNHRQGMGLYCSNTPTTACVVSWTFIAHTLEWFGIGLLILFAFGVAWTTGESHRVKFMHLRRDNAFTRWMDAHPVVGITLVRIFPYCGGRVSCDWAALPKEMPLPR